MLPHTHHTHNTRRAARRASTGDDAPTASAVPLQLLQDSFAMQAARRAERRRLFSFVRLLDRMLASSIHSLLLTSQRSMLACLQAEVACAAPAAPAAPTQSTSILAAAPGQQQQLIEVLQLDVLLDASSSDQLVLQPQACAWAEALAAWQHSLERAVRAVPSLLSHAQLQSLVDVAGDGSSGSGSSAGEGGLAQVMLGEDCAELHQVGCQDSATRLAVRACSAGLDVARECVCACSCCA